MLIMRWFNQGGGDWQPFEREIPATFEQQRNFFSGRYEPRVALPQASDDDIDFLIRGCCCHPSELPV